MIRTTVEVKIKYYGKRVEGWRVEGLAWRQVERVRLTLIGCVALANRTGRV